jgi:hypothetical protein
MYFNSIDQLVVVMVMQLYFVPRKLELEGFPLSQWVMLLFCKAQSIAGSVVGKSSF